MWGESFLQSFADFQAYIGTGNSLLVVLVFFTALIVIYSVFVFYFYKFLARKNLIDLNLNQYNYSGNPFLEKLLAYLFYIVEYIVILPIATFFWFTFVALFLLILAKAQPVSTVLLIAAGLVASVRITSYINENLSQDLAKMLPFTLIGLSLIDPNFFNISLFVQRLNEIPTLISHIPYYILFIIIMEFVMRFIDLFIHIFSTGSTGTEEEED